MPAKAKKPVQKTIGTKGSQETKKVESKELKKIDSKKTDAQELSKKNCIPCQKKIPAFDTQTAKLYLKEIPGWKLDQTSKEISREFVFVDFVQAISFVERVADIAEGEGHHPDILIKYNKVTLNLSTHESGGLTENDFILAAKIDSHAHTLA